MTSHIQFQVLDARVGKFHKGDGPEICVAELVLSERVFSID